MLNEQRDVIVMQGDTLADLPLESIIDTHQTQGNALTMVVKELDLS